MLGDLSGGASTNLTANWPDPVGGRLPLLVFGAPQAAAKIATPARRARSWSPPVLVSRSPRGPAFRPALATGAAREVAVTYYDLRYDVGGDAALWATSWRATSADGGASWREEPEGGPFDLRAAPAAAGLFLGDYAGLVRARDRARRSGAAPEQSWHPGHSLVIAPQGPGLLV